MLPALLEALEGGERDGLDLLACLRELAATRLLEQAARAPARGRAIAAEHAAHEHPLALPFLEPSLDPARVEVVARADVVDRDGAGERDPARQHLTPRGAFGEDRLGVRAAHDIRPERGDVAGHIVDQDEPVVDAVRRRDARRDQSTTVEQRGERIAATPLGRWSDARGELGPREI